MIPGMAFEERKKGGKWKSNIKNRKRKVAPFCFMSDFDFNYNYIKIDAIYIFYHVFVEKRICCIL